MPETDLGVVFGMKVRAEVHQLSEFSLLLFEQHLELVQDRGGQGVHSAAGIEISGLQLLQELVDRRPWLRVDAILLQHLSEVNDLAVQLVASLHLSYEPSTTVPEADD